MRKSKVGNLWKEDMSKGRANSKAPSEMHKTGSVNQGGPEWLEPRD